jgi:enoyl-CoA hydratase/carnithine racemase
MRLPTLISLIAVPTISAASDAPVISSSSPPSFVIKTTKITPSYWRATFSDPPLNIQGDAFFRDFYALVDQITSDPDVKVVVFDSSSETFFSNHVDLIKPLDQNLWPGNSRYWDSITRLAKAPVLTIAAIRGIAQNAGAEIAAVLDVRFGSKEKAFLGQLEVGFGKYCSHNFDPWC